MLKTTRKRPVKPGVPTSAEPEPWMLSLETRLAIHSDFWAEDRHLGITGDGDVYLRLDDAPARLVGDAEGGVDWPAELGAEPKWFLTEIGYLIDLWLDARRTA